MTQPYTVSVCIAGGATRSPLRAFGTLAEAIHYATESVARHFTGDLCEIHNERGELAWSSFGARSTTSIKPVCVGCERFMRMKKSGFYFTEGCQPKGSSDWQPYKVWAGDLWECPTCNHQTIAGTGMFPVAERHMPDFLDIRKETDATQLLVKDC